MRRFTRRIRCLDANGNITADYFQHETWVLVPAAAAKRAAMSDCKRGHPLNGENVFKTSNGARGCKECRRLHKLTDRAKINAKVA